MHTLVKQTYQDDKPKYDGAWWRYENGPSTESTLPRCTLPIVAVRLKAYVPEGGPSNNDLDMPEEGFLAKKSINRWLKKQMLYTKASQQHFKHLDIAAKKSAYRVHDYAENIPVPALDTTQFIDEFMEKHSSDVPKLKKEHITTAFSVFGCGLVLVEDDQVAEHCKQIHGLTEGITSLNPLQVIIVDKDQAFTCPTLLAMEDVGPEQKALYLDSIFCTAAAKGVFHVTDNNKYNADLKRNRAQEFLSEVKKACTAVFYGRFNMHLGNKLSARGQNIIGDFNCKWQLIEDCLYKAIGDEQEVNRMTNFLGLNYTKFTEAPCKSC